MLLLLNVGFFLTDAELSFFVDNSSGTPVTVSEKNSSTSNWSPGGYESVVTSF